MVSGDRVRNATALTATAALIEEIDEPFLQAVLSWYRAPLDSWGNLFPLPCSRLMLASFCVVLLKLRFVRSPSSFEDFVAQLACPRSFCGAVLGHRPGGCCRPWNHPPSLPKGGDAIPCPENTMS